MSTLFQAVPAAVLEGVGIAGFGVYVSNYAMLSLHKVRSDSVAYFATNGVAAAMVLVGLLSSFNLASAMIQIFWIGISVVAIVIRLRRRREGVVQADDFERELTYRPTKAVVIRKIVAPPAVASAGRDVNRNRTPETVGT